MIPFRLHSVGSLLSVRLCSSCRSSSRSQSSGRKQSVSLAGSRPPLAGAQPKPGLSRRAADYPGKSKPAARLRGRAGSRRKKKKKKRERSHRENTDRKPSAKTPRERERERRKLALKTLRETRRQKKTDANWKTSGGRAEAAGRLQIEIEEPAASGLQCRTYPGRATRNWAASAAGRSSDRQRPGQWQAPRK